MTIWLLFVAGLCLAETGKPVEGTGRQREIRKKMEASVEKQKAPAQKQARQSRGLSGQAPPTEKSWFTTPWLMESIEPLGPPMNEPVQADCVALPTDEVNSLIESAAQREGISVDLIRAVMERESGFRPCAVSSKGAQGLMQLMPATARELGVGDPFDPAENVTGGVKLLKQLMTKYAGKIDLVLSAYNAGQGLVDQEGGVPAIQETQEYVKAIRKKLAETSAAKPEIAKPAP